MRYGCLPSDTPMSVMRVVRMGIRVVFVVSWVSRQSAREHGVGGWHVAQGKAREAPRGSASRTSALCEGSGATWRGKQTQEETECLRRCPDGRRTWSRASPWASQSQDGSVNLRAEREEAYLFHRTYRSGYSCY